MKKIEVTEGVWYTDICYWIIGFILQTGRRYIPWFFYRKNYLDGHVIYLDKWITMREWQKIDKEVDDIMNNIKMEDPIKFEDIKKK